MSYLNCFGYKFVELSDPVSMREQLHHLCKSNNIMGTILVGTEGINFSLAGTETDIRSLKKGLIAYAEFNDTFFKEIPTDFIPFENLVVKLKREIVTMGDLSIQPTKKQGKDIAPEKLKQWLDENRDFTLLDTRNDYEVEKGTFDHAVQLGLTKFKQFPNATKQLHASLKKKPVVMFCTGGIRCEKASLALEQQGFEEVYQLEGGILNYFKQCGGEHYHGECFVFDDRGGVKPD